MRVGQQGTLTRQWGERGCRLVVSKQTEYEWCYLYGAVCPETGHAVGLALPESNTDMMNRFLCELEKNLSPQTHGILILDQASWHHSKNLYQSEKITLLHLPPYSPELNPAERVWAHLKQNYLSNRVFKDYEEIVDSVCEAWLHFSKQKDFIRSLTHCSWITGHS